MGLGLGLGFGTVRVSRLWLSSLTSIELKTEEKKGGEFVTLNYNSVFTQSKCCKLMI